MFVEGTYTLDIQASGYVEVGGPPISNLLIDLTIKTCSDDGTKYTLGNF